jgi:hypothetical protein
MTLKGTQENAQIRILLMLWDLGGLTGAVNKGEVNNCVKRSGEKATDDYQPILDLLAEEGAIAYPEANNVANKNKLQLTSDGFNRLKAGIFDPSFDFQNAYLLPDPENPGEFKKVQQIGARFGDALLKWIRQSENPTRNVTSENLNAENLTPEGLTSEDSTSETEPETASLA